MIVKNLELYRQVNKNNFEPVLRLGPIFTLKVLITELLPQKN